MTIILNYLWQSYCLKNSRSSRNGDIKFFEKSDVQMLIMDNSTIISLVEFAAIPKEVEHRLDLPFESQSGFSRVIFRNVAGSLCRIYLTLLQYPYRFNSRLKIAHTLWSLILFFKPIFLIEVRTQLIFCKSV